MVKTGKGNNAVEPKDCGYKYSWIAQFPPSLLCAHHLLICSCAMLSHFQDLFGKESTSSHQNRM